MSKANVCRAASLLMLALWITASFLPAYTYFNDGAPEARAITTGGDLIAGGIFFVLGENFSWFANLVGLGCFICLLLGRPPCVLVSLLGAAIAVTALQPVRFDNYGDHPPPTNYLPLAGAYVWASSFAVPIAAWAIVRGLRLPDRAPVAAPAAASPPDQPRRRKRVSE